MRHNDRLVDKDVDLEGMEQRALKARSRWERFMSNNNERAEDQVRISATLVKTTFMRPSTRPQYTTNIPPPSWSRPNYLYMPPPPPPCLD